MAILEKFAPSPTIAGEMVRPSSLVGNWNYPTAIRFGAGRLRELPEACRELGMGRPLLVTDPGLAALPMVDEALAINTHAGLRTAVFSQVKPNPVGRNVEEGVAAYREGGHDGVIAFGGGSALDAAKAIALMAGQTRSLWDFEDIDDRYTRVDERGMAPLVAVPTTSGTGSEVGRVSVIVDEAARKKKLIFHPKMLPSRVICDPELTVGLPPSITAAVGMDALSHNLEALCSAAFHPMADGIAVEAIRLIREALPIAYAEGANLEARALMMAASTMGATAFQKGLGVMHAIAHPLGARFDTHHGLTLAVLMPYALRFNREAIAAPLTRLAAYLGLPEPSFDAVLEWAIDLRQRLDIPHTLASLGVDAASVSVLADEALVDPSAPSNPRTLTASDLRMLIQAAIRG